MTKEVLIQSILGYNRTAAVQFLRRFTEEALGRYLRHLQYLVQPQHTHWVGCLVPGHTEYAPSNPTS